LRRGETLVVCRWPNSLLRSDVALAQVCKSKLLICLSPATSGGVANKSNNLAHPEAHFLIVSQIIAAGISRRRPASARNAADLKLLRVSGRNTRRPQTR